MLWSMRPLLGALFLFGSIAIANAWTCSPGPNYPGPYCGDCKIPKGWTTLKCDPNAECINKRVICRCGIPGVADPVWSAQPLCLYPARHFPMVQVPPGQFR